MGRVVRSRREQVGAVTPRVPTRRRPVAASAAMIELQRTAGNTATNRIVSQGPPIPLVPVVQRRPAGEYGLDAPAREGAYAKEAVTLWRTRKDLLLKEFGEQLVTLVVGSLKHPGIPDVTPGWATLGASGRFDQQRWMIDLDLAAFTPNASPTMKLGVLSFPQVTEIVGTIYHEARHADQNILVIRQLLDAKVPVADIKARTKIRGDVVDAVSRARFTDPLNAEKRAHATRMFDVMYGRHNQVLAFLIVDAPAHAAMETLSRPNSDLVKADPHVATFTRWQSAVLQPKVDAMKQATGLTQSEQTLQTHLAKLNIDLLDLRDAWNAIPDKQRPPPLPAADARSAAADAHRDMRLAYENLESETDAFRVEADVKQAFEAADRAWKPPPKPKRKRT